MTGAHIDGPRPLDPALAEAILRSVPQWFGLEQPLLDYSRRACELPNFTARVEAEPVAFLSLQSTSPRPRRSIAWRWRARTTG